MKKYQRSRLGQALYELFCLPVIIDCHCEKCEPKGSPELDILTVSSESEVFVTAQTSLISLMEDNTQNNVEVFYDCLSELCSPEGSSELDSQSIGRESEVYVTAQTSLTSLVEDNTQDNVEVFYDCLSELCSPEGSSELDSQSIGRESEVYVTAQTSLISLVEDNTQDNVEIPPRKKGKWKRRFKVLKDFFCEPVIIDCHCEKCEPRGSPDVKSHIIGRESEVYVTAQTSLISLVEDNTQDNVEVFYDCLSELCSPEGSSELDSQSIGRESEVYVTAQTSLISLVEANTQDNVEIPPRKKGKWKRRLKVLKDFFCEPVIIDCHCEKCEPRGSPDVKSHIIGRESEVYVTAQTSLISLVEANTQDNVEVFYDCLSELCSPEGSSELDSQSIGRESEVYVTAQTSLISLVEANTQDNVEIPPRKKGKWKRRLKVLKDFFCEPVIIDCHCEKCEPRGSPDVKSHIIGRESEVYVTAQTSLISLVEANTQDNVEVFYDCLSELCSPEGSSELDSQSIGRESEVYVTAQTSLISLVEDNTQDNVEIPPRKKGKWKRRLKVLKDFFCEPVIIDCHCEKCEPRGSPDVKSHIIGRESEVYVTAQTSLISLVEANTQDNVEVFYDCLSELCSPEGSSELDSQSIGRESEVYVTAQTSLISLVEANTQDNVEIPPRKKGKWKRRLKVLKDFFCEPVIIDCHCEECQPRDLGP